jgi:hypothetical protein
METHADKSEENKSHVVAGISSQHLSNGESAFQFADNRPEAIAQRKMQETINNSPQMQQLKAYQGIANNNPYAKQMRAYQAMADDFTSQTAQRKVNEEEETQQGKFESVQKKENNTGLPDNLKAGIENLSNYSLDDVKVYFNSDKPAHLQAYAYAQGTNIHLASGQEKHLPHEAWHVVQQKQGRVKPTIQGKVNVNDDTGLEKEADMMGGKALAIGQLTAQENIAQTHQLPLSNTNTLSNDKTAIQLMPEYMQVTGITHLVSLKKDGSLYNGSKYEENEYCEVSEGDIVQIENAEFLFSRRGPNQESFHEEDSNGQKKYQWFRGLKLNGVPVPEDIYVREDTIIPYSEGESLIENMTAMKDLDKMKWNGSGDKAFEDWSKDEGPEPETANCWNAILYAAYHAKLVDKDYIQRANLGGKDEMGPLLVRKIAESPAGRFMKDKGESAEAFKNRFAENQPDIPRGMVVVFHSAGFHVALSLGGGQVLELDKQSLVTVMNPHYNPNYVVKSREFTKKINSLKTRPSKKEEYKMILQEYETWKETNSIDMSFTKRMDNELQEKSITPGLDFYLLMLNLDGVYWGNLPSL